MTQRLVAETERVPRELNCMSVLSNGCQRFCKEVKAKTIQEYLLWSQMHLSSDPASDDSILSTRQHDLSCLHLLPCDMGYRVSQAGHLCARPDVDLPFPAGHCALKLPCLLAPPGKHSEVVSRSCLPGGPQVQIPSYAPWMPLLSTKHWPWSKANWVSCNLTWFLIWQESDFNFLLLPLMDPHADDIKFPCPHDARPCASTSAAPC